MGPSHDALEKRACCGSLFLTKLAAREAEFFSQRLLHMASDATLARLDMRAFLRPAIQTPWDQRFGGTDGDLFPMCARAAASVGDQITIDTLPPVVFA